MVDEPKGNGFNVVDLDNYTTVDLNPDKILFNNIGEYTDLMIIGYDSDNRVRIVSSFADSDGWLALLEKTKHIILREVLD